MAQARSTTGGAEGHGADAPQSPPVCSVSFCPICMVVTTASEIRPDFVEHLMVAGRELLLAVRAVIDARLEGAEQPVKLERLTIE